MESERITRKGRIDPLLKNIGWDIMPYREEQPLDQLCNCAIEEYETEKGPADYVLCVDGRIVAVVEAELTLSWYNLRMSKTVTRLDQHSSVPLPPEALDALGIEAGAELEVEIVGRALVVRSVEEARRAADFVNAFEAILSKRRTAYEELAKGPD